MFKSRCAVRSGHPIGSNIWGRMGPRRPRCWVRADKVLVGGRGHYLNSRIELGSGVLDLIRTHCDRLEQAPPGV